MQKEMIRFFLEMAQCASDDSQLAMRKFAWHAGWPEVYDAAGNCQVGKLRAFINGPYGKPFSA